MKFLKQNKQQPKRFSRQNSDTTQIDTGSEFPVLVDTKQIHRFNIFIDNALHDSQEMRNAISALGMASQDDFVTVHLNTPGGAVDSGLAFLHAMQQCEAPIHLSCTGTVASMGAIIASACESFSCEPFTNFMYHSVSFGYAAEAVDVVSYSVFTKQQSEAMCSYYCIGILTAAELDGIFNRKDVIWLNAEQFSERFQRKMDCQTLLMDYLDENDIPPSDVTPAKYVEYMKLVMAAYEQQQTEKALAASKLKRKPKAKPVKASC
jgi:ATP-dependent protease ClpP protease subunit